MSERSQHAWLLRRIGFGPAAGELDRSAGTPPGTVLDALVDPDGAGVAPAPDPWAGIDLDDRARTGGGQMVAAWLQAMATTPRPFEEWMRWYWHGHLVSSLGIVKRPALMVDQLRLYGRSGLGDFRSLLRAVTVDGAMLVYLDGAKSTRTGVNENYAREVLELFALGLGAYDEADVRAGAAALTGWTVATEAGGSRVRFAPRRHDDTAQTYLGRRGVHDVDTVIDAIVAHPACAPFVTGKLARSILGPDVDRGILDGLARDFARSGLLVRPLVQAIAAAGLDGHGTPLVRAPVPWLVAMVKATGADPAKAVAAANVRLLKAAGQVPLAPPNVAGWPGGPAWLGASTTVSRWNLAVALAALSPPAGRARTAAAGGAWADLADALGVPDGFSPATVAALDRLRGTGRAGDTALALAMASPDVVIA